MTKRFKGAGANFFKKIAYAIFELEYLPVLQRNVQVHEQSVGVFTNRAWEVPDTCELFSSEEDRHLGRTVHRSMHGACRMPVIHADSVAANVFKVSPWIVEE
jgi:hypothetical protein